MEFGVQVGEFLFEVFLPCEWVEVVPVLVEPAAPCDGVVGACGDGDGEVCGDVGAEFCESVLDLDEVVEAGDVAGWGAAGGSCSDSGL